VNFPQNFLFNNPIKEIADAELNDGSYLEELFLEPKIGSWEGLVTRQGASL